MEQDSRGNARYPRQDHFWLWDRLSSLSFQDLLEYQMTGWKACPTQPNRRAG
jgi:hypothetical protein